MIYLDPKLSQEQLDLKEEFVRVLDEGDLTRPYDLEQCIEAALDIHAKLILSVKPGTYAVYYHTIEVKYNAVNIFYVR
jgi:hypothetical protein